MELKKLAVMGMLMLAATTAQGAEKGYPVKYMQTIIEDGRTFQQAQHQSYRFRVEILSDNQGSKFESTKNGRPYVTASKGERYSVRIYNPMPVRVAVNLTVDGLNSISGKPSGISDGEKWMIDPYSTITIPGWQISNGEARRFFFTDKPKSYAKWRGDMTGKDLSVNCGVIGAAFFWNQQELDQYYASHPIYRNNYTYNNKDYYLKRAPKPSQKAYDTAGSAAAPAPSLDMNRVDREPIREEAQEQAGTGMGERQSNPTYQVDFSYNTGMYSLSQALVIYYGFEPVNVPNPFPDTSFAPEQP